MVTTLEVIAFTLESCITIEKAGAHRIELCANPEEGGTTPSVGMMRKAREKVSIDVFPIIRPRGGDFFYTSDEFDMMMLDVKASKEAGCNGVVIGLLQKDGTVDVERTKKLVDYAYPLEVTFHRAFDRVSNAFEALEAVINCGCTRILTSGLHPTVNEGKHILKQLVEQAQNRIVIMPGSGVRANNISELAAFTGAEEMHTSARKLVQSKMDYTSITMQEQLSHYEADKEQIEQMLQKIR